MDEIHGENGKNTDKDGKKHNTGAADLQAGAHGHEHLPTVEGGEEHVEVTP